MVDIFATARAIEYCDKFDWSNKAWENHEEEYIKFISDFPLNPEFWIECAFFDDPKLYVAIYRYPQQCMSEWTINVNSNPSFQRRISIFNPSWCLLSDYIGDKDITKFSNDELLQLQMMI